MYGIAGGYLVKHSFVRVVLNWEGRENLLLCGIYCSTVINEGSLFFLSGCFFTDNTNYITKTSNYKYILMKATTREKDRESMKGEREGERGKNDKRKGQGEDGETRN